VDQRFDELLAENRDLYLFEYEAGRVLFRLLPYQKYTSAKYIILSYPTFRWAVEDDIWEDCVIEHSILGGASPGLLASGVVSTVVQLILKMSCSVHPEQANEELDEARGHLQDAVQQAIIFICEAFPSYLPEALEKMTWKDILKRLAQSEQILGKTFEFRGVTSHHVDDSGKIFKDLDELSQDHYLDQAIKTPVNFAKDNGAMHEADWGSPSGDFNIRNRR
jgi:hypothetical protein